MDKFDVRGNCQPVSKTRLYTSKWNPIEYRLFPHLTRSLQGIILTSHQLAKELIEKTTTKSGLKVFSYIFNRVYSTGRKVAKGFKESM